MVRNAVSVDVRFRDAAIVVAGRSRASSSAGGRMVGGAGGTMGTPTVGAIRSGATPSGAVAGG